MNRFRKGTTDHDGDGKMGGSLKETDMAKPSTKKTAAKKPAANTEIGMEPGVDTTKLQNDIQAKFDKADAAGDPLTPKERRAVENEALDKASPEERAAMIDQAAVGLQVRGY